MSAEDWLIIGLGLLMIVAHILLIAFGKVGQGQPIPEDETLPDPTWPYGGF